MKLFPFVLIRISGGPFEELQNLQFQKTADISRQLASALNQFDVLRAQICDALYTEIAETTDPAKRLALINLKRDVFNGRRVSDDQLRPYISAYDEIERLREEGAASYDAEMTQIRSHLRSLSANENLQKGLLLSSQALLKSLPAYLRNTSHIYDAKDRKTELGLTRFISRMYAKTSPFSTFTNLAMAKIVESADEFLRMDEESETISSHVKLNNFLFARMKLLLTNNREIYRSFRVAVNRTVREEEKHFLFLTNSSNIESFQRLPISDPLKIILSLCAEPLVYSKLIQSLSESIDAQYEEIESYVNQLIEYGFLEFQIEIGDSLQWLQNAANEFSRSDSGRRNEILMNAYSRFKEMQADAQDSFSLRCENVFYEDTTRNLRAAFSANQLQQIVKSLDAFLKNSPLLDEFREEKEKMHSFFETKYGTSASIDLLTFYEDYFREAKKPEAEARKAPVTPFQQKRDAWISTFLESIRDQLQLEEINFSIQGDRRATTSHGAFLQFFQDQQKWKAVVNATFPGYGKMISRFLQLFDPSITNELRQWNLLGCDDALFAENSDASFFNANLHPPLMPFEIWMPGAQNILPAEKQIRVTDLSVSVNEKTRELQLIHKIHQKRVYVFDVSLQGEIDRSPLFRLLGHFTLGQQHFFHPLLEAINGSVRLESTPNIHIHPRLIIDNSIVIQRKAWMIPRQILPVRSSNESDWQFFSRVDRWRLRNKIPVEVFVFAAQPNELRLDKNLTLDDTKPQYVCFQNPLLVNLLEKAMSRVPEALRIEEMLPNSEQLLKLHGGHHVTEFVVQWYS